MIKSIFTKQSITVLALVAIVGGILGAAIPATGHLTTGSTGPREDVYAHPLFMLDRSNARELAGAAHNIFFGTVISGGGIESPDGLLETQFQVSVLENLKGKLEGTVTVNQRGGQYPDGRLYGVRGDLMVEPQETYQFATRFYPAMNWHTAVPQYGDLKLDLTSESLTDSQIMDSDAARNLRTRFFDAVSDAITFPYE